MDVEKKRSKAGLKPCTECGTLNCSRMIATDGSIWPSHDTGYRYVEEKKK